MAIPSTARLAAGRTDLVRDLVAAGMEPSARIDGASLAQWCAYYGDVSALRFLLDRGAALSDLGVDHGIGAAAFHGHWQLCQFLLESGAPVQGVATRAGETPLHSALCTTDRTRHDAVVRVLLDAGADANAATLSGAPTGAFMRDARTRGETPLHRAAAFGSATTIGLLLDAGAHRDARDAHGDTPLAWANWHGRTADILRLLCYGDFRIHPDHRGLRANLVGDPLPDHLA
jgi:ankyrin repeat protein